LSLVKTAKVKKDGSASKVFLFREFRQIVELTPGADICFNPATPGNADLEPNRQGGEVVVEQDHRP
jgi:hypothetical protein